MPRYFSLVSSSALIGSVFLLTGCPPPPDLTQWQRPKTNIDETRVAMGQCGVPLPGPEPSFTENETVLYFQCMEGKGFTYKGDFHICDYHKNTPACIGKQQGHPLSQRQLEALPFVADEGFHPIKPDSGRVESQLISWRKAGASLHFSHAVENDKLALQVMYECGYPKPLGSVPFIPTVLKAAKVQQCMLDKGFEPKHKLMLVCRNYPQVTGCKK